MSQREMCMSVLLAVLIMRQSPRLHERSARASAAMRFASHTHPTFRAPKQELIPPRDLNTQGELRLGKHTVGWVGGVLQDHSTVGRDLTAQGDECFGSGVSAGSAQRTQAAHALRTASHSPFSHSRAVLCSERSARNIPPRTQLKNK